MAKLFRIVANEVPTRKLKAANLSQHLFSIHGLKVFLLGLIRNGSERHLSLDHRDIMVSQADLIAGVGGGLKADSRSVEQIPNKGVRIFPGGGRIGKGPDGGVVAARGVGTERIVSDGGVVVANFVVKERTVSDGGVGGAPGVERERLDSEGGIELASGVVKERIDPAGGVGAARGVAKERLESEAVLSLPVVLLNSV